MESDGKIAIENVWPDLDCGKFCAKAVIGDIFTVRADIFTHGTDLISADLKFRVEGSETWESVPMQ
jgi:starch synthase (maltosyl-transferring)